MNTNEQLGMLLFLLSEAVFFIMLILSYAYFHGRQEAQTAVSVLDLSRAALFTIALISSSFTMHMVQRRKSQRSERRWLLTTIGLGALFLFGQSTEYARLIQQNITISRDLFGTTFFTLTGFHGLHVTAGLILLAIAYALSRPNDTATLRQRFLPNAGLYWHFVDVVWIVIFTEIYLWPHL